MGEEIRIYVAVGPSGAGKTRLLNHWSLGLKREGWARIKISPDTHIDWSEWFPESPTLLSIDYIYGYDEVIAAITSREQETFFEHPVRLLLLDHATPDSMQGLLRDPRWGFDERGSDNFINCFFNDAPLKLVIPDSKNEEQPAEYEHFLAQIMCAVAFHEEDTPSKYIDTPDIQRGLTYLKETAGAKQALFAALVGNAIRQKKRKH